MPSLRKTNSPAVSDVLKRAIAESDQSLSELARAADIKYSEMHRFLAGEWSLPTKALDRLCRSLDVELRRRTEGE